MRRRNLMTVLTGAMAYPLLAGAQQQPMPVIGYLSAGAPESDDFRLTAFRQGLNETSYVEGQNVAIEYRWAQGQNDRLPALAAELVRRQVTVIATVGPPPLFAVKAATSTIPIVFVVGIDPVESGLVASLNRPGGNITGVALISAELAGKRLDLLHELMPTAALVALLVDPSNPTSDPQTRNLQDAARSLGLALHVLRASTASEIDAAFDAIIELRAGALVLGSGPFFTNQRAQIVALAARHAMPAIYGSRLFPVAGGLMSYGADLADSFRQAGVYTGKILKGARPADLPVEQVVKIELVINLATAKALGLTVPMTLLGRADEVVE
jgi:putative tryptophan/tyrosine transport system substrate-binding protein